MEDFETIEMEEEFKCFDEMATINFNSHSTSGSDSNLPEGCLGIVKEEVKSEPLSPSEVQSQTNSGYEECNENLEDNAENYRILNISGGLFIKKEFADKGVQAGPSTIHTVDNAHPELVRRSIGVQVDEDKIKTEPASPDSVEDQDKKDFPHRRPSSSDSESDIPLIRRSTRFRRSVQTSSNSDLYLPGPSGLHDLAEINASNSNVGAFFVDRKGKIFCVYCETFVTHFSRHIKRHHPDEDLVKKLTLCNADQKEEKRSILVEIKKKGMVHYNNKYPQSFLMKKTTKKTDDLVPCTNCRGLYSKNNLYRHFKTCAGVEKAPRTLLRSSKSMLDKLEESEVQPCEYLRKEIYPQMLPDHITRLAKEDPVLINYANYLSMRYESEKHLLNYVRSKIRLLGHFIHAFKLIDPVKNLGEVFDSKKWNTLIKAVNKCAGYKAESGSYKSPNVVNSLGLALTQAAKDLLVNSNFDTEEGEKKINQIQHWITFFHKNYSSAVGKNAAKIAAKKKWKKLAALPIVEDIMKLNAYLKKNQTRAIHKLTSNFDKESWTELNRCLIVEVLIFNRKRVGEVNKLLLKDYLNKREINLDSDIYQSLDPGEQIMSGRYFCMFMKGRLGWPVPVLLDRFLCKGIDLLIKYRETAGVSEENIYLFAKDNLFFNGSKALVDASSKCGSKTAHLLKNTFLRKQLATITQTLSLSQNEIKVLAAYMGHTTETDDNFFRLPSDALHTTKLSKLFDALNKGTLEQYKGCDLWNIPINFGYDSESDQETGPPAMPKENVETVLEELPDTSVPVVTTPSENPSLRKWTTPQKETIMKEFRHHFEQGTLPSFAECRQLKEKFPCFHTRSVATIKVYVANHLRKEKNK